MTNLFRFTFLSKNASVNYLESHSCKNKGLKVPCFHTLTKNIRGRGAHPGNAVIPSEPAILAGDEGSQCSEGCRPQSANHESLVTNHESLPLTPLDSALTSKQVSKSFTSNTYEKHTQGEGGLSHQPPFLPLPPLPHPVSERETPVYPEARRATHHGSRLAQFRRDLSSLRRFILSRAHLAENLLTVPRHARQ